MKVWRTMMVAGGVVGLATMGLRAQTVAAEPSTTPDNTAQVAEAPSPPTQPAATGQRASPGAVEQWLKRMKMRNPEEFERLSKLRQEDPVAFQKTLKERLEKIRADKAGNLTPDIAATPKPTMGEHGVATPRAHEAGAGKSRDQHLETNKLDQEIRSLMANYKTAPVDERKKLQVELRKKINESFDLREKSRHENIQRLEAQLVMFKKDEEKKKASRDAIVEQRLKELTKETPLPK